MSNVTKTKFSEERIKTLVPEEMLNKFLVNDLVRTWHETMIDEDTQKPVIIERSEIILQRGILLNADNMQELNFHLQCGDITEPIEVSNQSRQAHHTDSYKQWPYTAKVDCNGETKKFLLQASGVQQAIDIIKDYCELQYNGSFHVSEIKAYDNVVILVDNYRDMPKDEAAVKYLQGEIEFEEFMDEVAKTDTHEDDAEKKANRKFYQIKAAVYENGDKRPDTEGFMVLADDAERAIMVINAWMQSWLRKRKMEAEEKGEKFEVNTISATIDESKIVSFTKLVPKKFCEVYYEHEKEAK